MRAPNHHSLLTLAGLCLLPLALSGHSAHAESSSSGEEFLSSAEAVPPNVIFLLDLSNDMDEPCGEVVDTAAGETPDLTADTCLESAIEAIDQLTQHYDWAYFGVVGTTDDANEDTFYEIAPIGSTHSEISAALASLTSSGTDVRNISEALADLQKKYISKTASHPRDPWKSAPIQYDCQETHVITIAVGPPAEDDNPSVSTTSSMSTDVMCDTDYLKDDNPLWSGSDEWCLYDNVVTYNYNEDARRDLDGTQNVITHTVGIKISGTDLAEELFGNASDQTGNEGIYNVANSGDEILGSIMTIMGFIRSGFYTRSTPVLNADGDRMIYSFYEITGDNPLAEGHIRAYEIDTDPDSSNYGELIDTNGKAEFGYALWDGGDLLVSRPVEASEDNPDLRQGEGQRDIYTWVPELYGENVALYSDDLSGTPNVARMGFDAEFAETLKLDSSLVNLFLDDDDDDGDGKPDDNAYDLNLDGVVDHEDMQSLIDFARGLPSATYRYLDQERGYWKLGDSPHSVPVVVSPRNDTYTTDPTYKTFLEQLEAGYTPETVFVAANDGMLHAFRMRDEDPAQANTGVRSEDEDDDLAGEEMWAWMPAYILYDNDEDTETWSGRLIDLMWYGRTFLFDGSPVVEDVWIDEDDDGTRSCTTVPGDCEWHRVLVVQQGKGGPVTLALDITDIDEPEFLWEQVNDSDWSANAYTVSRPVIGLIRDQEDLTDIRDRWVVIWGSGRAVPNATSEDYYASSEANIYMWHASARDTTLGTYDDARFFSDAGDNGHPDSAASPEYDSDGRYEYGYISGAIAAVDVNSDGDMDTLYFPVSTSYKPSDEGGSGVGDPADPGHTWMYKAVIDTSDPDDMEWCEFLDPYDNSHGFSVAREEVYYAATTSWLSDGGLGVYWGTGTPYSRMSTSTGYFYAFKDSAPGDCPAVVSPLCDDGYYELEDAGEGLTGDPIVYAGTVYFSTYAPGTDSSGSVDYCETGTGRLYGLDFQTCTGALDPDGDGSTQDSIENEGYQSAPIVTEQGQVFTADASVDPDNFDDVINTPYDASGTPFMSVETVGRRELF